MEWILKRIKFRSATQPVVIQVAPAGSEESAQSDLGSTATIEGESKASMCIFGQYFEFLYKIGLCPYSASGANRQNGLWGIIHKVLFGTMVGLSIMQTVDGIKYFTGFRERAT